MEEQIIAKHKSHQTTPPLPDMTRRLKPLKYDDVSDRLERRNNYTRIPNGQPNEGKQTTEVKGQPPQEPIQEAHCCIRSISEKVKGTFEEIFSADAFPCPLTIDRAHRVGNQRRQEVHLMPHSPYPPLPDEAMNNAACMGERCPVLEELSDPHLCRQQC